MRSHTETTYSIKPTLLAIASTVVLALSPASSVLAANDFNVKFPVGGAVPNPCTGEIMLHSGMIHVRGGASVDGSGGFHVSFNLNSSKWKAVGATSGDRYIIKQNEHEQLNVNGNNGQANFSFSEELTVNHLGRGTGDDWVVDDNNFHITFNANGVPTAMFINLSGGFCE